MVKHATGRAAGQLICDRVILEAKRLLLSSGASVSEVAYALNYDDDVSYLLATVQKGRARFAHRVQKPETSAVVTPIGLAGGGGN